MWCSSVTKQLPRIRILLPPTNCCELRRSQLFYSHRISIIERACNVIIAKDRSTLLPTHAHTAAIAVSVAATAVSVAATAVSAADIFVYIRCTRRIRRESFWCSLPVSRCSTRQIILSVSVFLWMRLSFSSSHVSRVVSNWENVATYVHVYLAILHTASKNKSSCSSKGRWCGWCGWCGCHVNTHE